MLGLVKSLLAFSLVLSCSWLDAAAQRRGSEGLLLTGSVQNIGTRCIDGKPVAEISLYMQFRNDTGSTVLLIPPNFDFTKRVEFITGAFAHTAPKAVTTKSFQYDPFSEQDLFEKLPPDLYKAQLERTIYRLDTAKPIAAKTLEPGDYYEFRDTAWVKSGFRIELNDDRNASECDRVKGAPKPEHQAMRVEYHLSLKENVKGEGLLETLRDRWRSYGLLIIDETGDLTFTSQAIAFADRP